MGEAAAKKGDEITASDTHIEIIPGPPPVPTPFTHDYKGIIDGELSADVNIAGMPAAVEGSTSTNTPPHIPKSAPFQSPPSNKGTIKKGSQTVKINGKGAARNGDMAETCNDPSDMPVGTVKATGTVNIG